MQIKDLSNKITAHSLNESLSRNFGYRLSLDKFSDKELEEVNIKLSEKVTSFEKNSSFDSVLENHEYQKNRAMLDVIRQAISERSLSEEQQKKKQKFVKGMQSKTEEFKKRYGDKCESVIDSTATKMAKSESIDQALSILSSVLSERVITEGEEERAALIMSSRDMVDRVTGWLEDVASMKAETMLELVDSIRDELGSDVAEQYSNTVKPALDELYTSLEQHRTTLAQAVSILTGEEGPVGASTAAQGGDSAAISGDINAEMTDEFAATEPATGGTEPAGRAKRESIEYSRKLGQILSSSKKKINEDADSIIRIIRNLKSRADSKKQSAKYSWAAVSAMVQNLSEQSLDYDAFKQEYEKNPALANLIDRFDDQGLVLKTKKKPEQAVVGDKAKAQAAVNSSAKRAATKLLKK